jgi:hypothetical protein
MNYSSFKAFAKETASLSTAYFYTADELSFLTVGEVKSFPFGESDKDLVEVTVFSTEGDLVTSSYFDASVNGSKGKYTPFTRSYVDVTNSTRVYSYSKYQSNFAVVGNENTQSIVMNVQDVLKSLSIQEGNYKIGILPVRNVVGNPFDSSQKLVIDEISPSRTEIAVIPHVLVQSTNPVDIKLNQEFDLFSNSKIQPKYIIDDLIESLEKVQLYTTYIDIAKKNPDTDQSIKFFYSLKTDIDVVNFITDTYYGVQKGSLKSGGMVSTRNVFGILDQFKNFLFENYESITTFDEIQDYFYTLFSYILNQELNQITNNRPQNYDDIVSFFRQIYFDSIFVPSINFIENRYKDNFSGYLKNVINFGDGTILPIVRTGVVPSTDESTHSRLILKLRDTLPDGYSVGDNLWISNISVSSPILQDLYFFSNQAVVTIPIKGPNFNIKLENEGNSTVEHSLESIVGESGSLYDELYSKLRYKIEEKAPTNVDYRYFENFVKFSSVEERLGVFEYKQNRIEEIRSLIADIDVKLVLLPTDEFLIKEKSDLNAEWNSLESSMDGYENFLYNNPNWFSEHTRVYSGMSSGSRYDRDNGDSLQNNLPSSVIEVAENYEYVRFVNLIGHYFDNLTLYITQFTEKNDASSSEIEGISKDVVYNMLSSLGWEPEIGRENLPLILASFSKSDFDVDSPLYDKVGDMSEDDRNKFIWKRILNSLPFILKSKGTEAAINALISCYGIPRNIIQIKEYGGVEYTTELDQNSLYIIDETKYSPYFSGSGEYFNVPWTGSAQSLEFNFSFEPNKTSDEGKIFRLAVGGTNWAIGIVKEKGNDWGKAFFTIQNTGSNTLTAMTERAPFFNGDVYSLVLRKSKVSADFNISPTASIATIDNYPQRYSVLVRRNEDSRTTFQASASMFLSGSYNTSFRQPTRLYLGNYQQNTSSLSLDPEAFFGTIDEIKIWENFLSTTRFNHHASFKGAYDTDNPQSMVEKNLVRISFSTPINLNTGSGNLTIQNSAFRTMSSEISASNFPFAGSQILNSVECDTYTATPTFPYQFKKFETRQTMNLPNFGSNKFRSNKVNYKQQILSSNLSPDSRSTLRATEDSTVDTNKLGIFFSPTEQINLEIIKFFGNFEFGDLIGKPSDVYERTYGRFEKFKEVFYSQGFGQVDYQSFMNLVRAYFDKSLFKYIKKLVPVRAKLVDGLLIEPSILERPKIQLKPIVQETVNINVADLMFVSKDVPSELVPQLTQSIKTIVTGTSLYEDSEGFFFPDRLEPFGFEILAKDGVTYYKDDYWRVEVIPIDKSYSVRNKNKPTSSMSDAEAYATNRGEFKTIIHPYEQVNISKFPTVTTIPDFKIIAANMNFIGSISGITLSGGNYLSGPVSNDVTLVGSFQNYGLDANMVSSSLVSGSANVRLGITATIRSGSNFQVNAIDVYNSNYQVYLLNGMMTASLSSLDSDTSLFDILVGNASGFFFSRIRDSAYSYRHNLSSQNSPLNSYPLNGYYGTHYKYKKSLNNRNPMVTLDNYSRPSGIFKKGLQTERTTIQSGSGILDNSLPVIISSVTT